MNQSESERTGGNRALSTRWVRALLDGGAGACIIDRHGRAVRSTRAFQRLVGYSGDELARLPFSVYTADVDLERNELLWDDLMAGRRSAYTLDKRYLTRDGRVVSRPLTVFRTRDAILGLIGSSPLVVSGEATYVVAGGSDSAIVVSQASPQVAIVELQGEHDLLSSDQVDAALGVEVRAQHGIVVDLSNASFIDASVLHALAKGHASCREAGLGFAVQLGTTRLVRRIFEATGLLDQLRCADGREQALDLARTPA